MSLAFIARFYLNGDGFNMASGVTKMYISIATQVGAKRDTLAFTQFTAPPDFHNTKLLREELAIFISAFP